MVGIEVKTISRSLTIIADDHIDILAGTKRLSLSKEQPSCQVQKGLDCSCIDILAEIKRLNPSLQKVTKLPTCDRN